MLIIVDIFNVSGAPSCTQAKGRVSAVIGDQKVAPHPVLEHGHHRHATLQAEAVAAEAASAAKRCFFVNWARTFVSALV